MDKNWSWDVKWNKYKILSEDLVGWVTGMLPMLFFFLWYFFCAPRYPTIINHKFLLDIFFSSLWNTSVFSLELFNLFSKSLTSNHSSWFHEGHSIPSHFCHWESVFLYLSDTTWWFSLKGKCCKIMKSESSRIRSPQFKSCLYNLTRCLYLGKLFVFFMIQFFQLQNEDDNRIISRKK